MDISLCTGKEKRGFMRDVIIVIRNSDKAIWMLSETFLANETLCKMF